MLDRALAQSQSQDRHGDDPESAERVRTAAGPGLMAAYHSAFEIFGEAVVASLPGGQRWLEVVSSHYHGHRGGGP